MTTAEEETEGVEAIPKPAGSPERVPRVVSRGKLIHEDPGVHSDTTEEVEVKIDKAGWYPLAIVYFQKRYTATLAVRWAAPGEKKFASIPGKALAHKK